MKITVQDFTNMIAIHCHLIKNIFNMSELKIYVKVLICNQIVQMSCSTVIRPHPLYCLVLGTVF